MTEYHPVTKEELEQISMRGDCAEPEAFDCVDCKYEDADGNCTCMGFNELKTLILSRPDPLEILEKWVEHNKRRYIGDRGEYDFFSSDYLNIILEELRTNPEAVRQQGIKEGWWKE